VKPLAGLVGIYEKSLPETSNWQALLGAAAQSGYSFFEMSVDESAERMSRLDWPPKQRAEVRGAVQRTGVLVGTISLSAQRAYPMGSADPQRRARSLHLAQRALQLAADLGTPLVQLAGYFTFYEPGHPDARAYFLEGLAVTAEHARELGIRLAIENVDGNDVVNVDQGMALIRDSGTQDTVGLYVDVGNNVGHGYDPVDQLRRAWPMIDAIQLKDAKPGVFRRVAFGEGAVPWQRVFAFLTTQGYEGPLAVEMWNDEGDPNLARGALTWLANAGLGELRDVRRA
jgi:predicted hexulose-6-phosphate isomerase